MALVGITGSLFKDLLAPTVTEATLKNALVKNSGLARDEIRQNQMITDLANPLDAFNKYKREVEISADEHSKLLHKHYAFLKKKGFSDEQALNMATEVVMPSYERSIKVIKGVYPLANDTETLVNAVIGNRVKKVAYGL